MKILRFLLYFLLPVSCFLLAFSNSLFALTVTATGKGRTISEAKINARINAAQQAIGFFIKSDTTFKSIYNGNNIQKNLQENILRITRSFTNNEQELERHEDADRHTFTVTLRIDIQGSELLQGLSAGHKYNSYIDGAFLVADAISKQKWEQETSQALTELFTSFSADEYIITNTSANAPFDMKNNTLKLNLDFKFDREKYFSNAVPSFISVLDYATDFSFHGLPFVFNVNHSTNGAVVNIEYDINSLARYAGFMLSNSCKGTNIFIQTKDCYFNAYSVNSKAFQSVIDCIQTFRPSLAVKFFNEPDTSYISIDALDRNMNNIIFFFDAKLNSLFIVPAFGYYNGNKKDFCLLYSLKDSLTVNTSPDELLNISRGQDFAQCYVVRK